jgi:hypothetical protein
MLGKVAGGLGAFVPRAIALYPFLRLRKLNRFEAYCHEIRQIERVACGLEQDLKSPRTKGEGLVTGRMAAINDTRSALPLALASRRGQKSCSVPSPLAEMI